MRDVWAGRIPVQEWQLQRHARRAFYTAIETAAPWAFQNLIESCVEIARETDVVKLAAAHPSVWVTEFPLGRCVSAWATRHGLDVPWLVIDMMVRLIDIAHPEQHGERPVTLLWANWTRETALSPDPGAIFRFSLPTREIDWPFTEETGASFKQRVLQEVGKEIDSALSAVEPHIKRMGAEPFERRQIEKHMDWLVLRVVGKHSAAELADQEKVSRRAVEIATVSAARMIGFPVAMLRVSRLRS